MADIAGFNDGNVETAAITGSTESNGYTPNVSIWPGEEGNLLFKQFNEGIESKRIRVHNGVITLDGNDIPYINKFTGITYDSRITVDQNFPLGKALHIHNDSDIVFYVANFLISPNEYIVFKAVKALNSNVTLAPIRSNWGGFQATFTNPAEIPPRNGFKKPVAYRGLQDTANIQSTVASGNKLTVELNQDITDLLILNSTEFPTIQIFGSKAGTSSEAFFTTSRFDFGSLGVSTASFVVYSYILDDDTLTISKTPIIGAPSFTIFTG